MRAHRLIWLGVLAATACDPYSEADEGTVEETDVGLSALGIVPDQADGFSDDSCDEGYSVPGPFGVVSDKPVDAHELTFGEDELIGASEAQGVVGPDPKHVHLGWPGRDTSNSVSFTWSTDTGTLASLVQFGEGTKDAYAGADPEFDYEGQGVSFAYGGSSGEQFRVHELKLCGRLSPGTTYSYRVGGEGHWSEVFEFTTPGEPGSFDSFTMVIAGDSRGAYEEWGTLVDQMLAENPDLFVFSGDMVEVGSNQNEWFSWFEASNNAFAENFFVPAHGNHEFLAVNYFSLFSLPGNEQWYAVDYGPATIAALNDTVSDALFKEDAQVDFLENEVGGSEAPWKFAMHHTPIYSTCSRHGSDENLREFWQPAYETSGVDVVFAGHNHIYERSAPIGTVNGESVALDNPGEGVLYLVSGGAGAPLYEEYNSGQWFADQASAQEHYIVATFDDKQASFKVKAINTGDEIDSWTMPIDSE